MEVRGFDQEGFVATDMDVGVDRARSHKPNLAHFLQYGLMLAGDEILVEPGVRMKLTNQSRNVARRLELLEAPKLVSESDPRPQPH